MFIVVTGGSGSGKSEYAEEKTVSVFEKVFAENLIYAATMRPFGQDALFRIKRHRNMRKGKGFVTVECFSCIESLERLSGLTLYKSVVLLECLSNLVANEMFLEDGSVLGVSTVTDRVIKGLKFLVRKCAGLIVVTNEIFSDGLVEYDDLTLNYIKALGNVNRFIALSADSVVEVVCGIPIRVKGGVY